MAHLVLSQAKIWLAQYDLSGVLNSIALEYGAGLQDDTNFASGGTRTRVGGLKTVAAQVEGFFEGDTIDKELFDRIAVADVPISIAPEGGTEGNRAFTFRAMLGDYAPGGSIGEMLRFSAGGEASQGPLVRGTLMHNQARTATANGTARQLGAVSSTQRIYAALHVLAASGTLPTLDIKLQSDDASGFLSAVDRITFAQKTAIGSEWASTAGAIADDWWRLAITIGGTSPSFTFAVVAGIA